MVGGSALSRMQEPTKSRRTSEGWQSGRLHRLENRQLERCSRVQIPPPPLSSRLRQSQRQQLCGLAAASLAALVPRNRPRPSLAVPVKLCGRCNRACNRGNRRGNHGPGVGLAEQSPGRCGTRYRPAASWAAVGHLSAGASRRETASASTALSAWVYRSIVSPMVLWRARACACLRVDAPAPGQHGDERVPQTVEVGEQRAGRSLDLIRHAGRVEVLTEHPGRLVAPDNAQPERFAAAACRRARTPTPRPGPPGIGCTAVLRFLA